MEMKTTEESTCVIEGKNMGEVCVNQGGFTISLTSNAIEKIKHGLMDKLKYMDVETRKLASTRLREMESGAGNVIIPSGEIKMVGTFQIDDTDSVLLLSLSDEMKEKMKLKGTVIKLAMKKDDMKLIMDHVPDGIKKTRRAEDFWKSVSTT